MSYPSMCEMGVPNQKDSKCKGPKLEMNLVCLRTRKSVGLLWEVKGSGADELGRDQLL